MGKVIRAESLNKLITETAKAKRSGDRSDISKVLQTGSDVYSRNGKWTKTIRGRGQKDAHDSGRPY